MARLDQGVEAQAGGDHSLDRRRNLRTQHPGVVGQVLDHRSQTFELGPRSQGGDLVGRVRRLEIHPADHAGDERGGVGQVQQEIGLRPRRRGLDQDGALDARCGEQGRQVAGREVAMDRREVRRQPAVVAAGQGP